uniref:Putative secreted protein ovary overexpressed n=1 Tax=Rhipicephalus microplus TaxID=6941 RepID=A0A6M2DDX5_RHIMP
MVCFFVYFRFTESLLITKVGTEWITRWIAWSEESTDTFWCGRVNFKHIWSWMSLQLSHCQATMQVKRAWRGWQQHLI